MATHDRKVSRYVAAFRARRVRGAVVTTSEPTDADLERLTAPATAPVAAKNSTPTVKPASNAKK